MMTVSAATSTGLFRPRSRVLAPAAAVPALALALALAAPLTAQDDPPPSPLQVAQTTAQATRARRDAAFEALETLILDLEDDHQALVRGATAAGRRQTLALAISDALPAVMARDAAASANGRRILRDDRRRLLEQAIAEAAVGTTSVDERLVRWLASDLAEVLVDEADLSVFDPAAMTDLITRRLPADESWWDLWNRSVRLHRPEVVEWSGAQQAHEAAALDLDRLRHPERYGPRGEPPPPGMVIVPGGRYTLGPGSGWERPLREVTLDAFALDRHEVTQAEYAAFVAAAEPGERPDLLPAGWTLDAGGLPVAPADRDDHPVLGVSWDQAFRYAARADKRLPTEDEWEAAAAGRNGRAYPFGDRFDPERANGRGGPGHTLPVGSHPEAPSPVGCFDMAGNVWEWTATRVDGGVQQAPGTAMVNLVIRGGGYDSPREELASRHRQAALGSAPLFGAGRPVGFRCARDLR